MALNKQQQAQIARQLKAHQHKRYTINILLTDGYSLENFVVLPHVMRPEKMTSLFLGRWLFFNNGLYKDKTVLDMGSGTGFLGIITGLYGAKKVVFLDIDESAVKNTKENVRIFKQGKISKVFQSDLFERINGKFDLIIFNHPFFGDLSKKYTNIAMINDGQLLGRFLTDAKRYLNPGGKIIMPYFHLAGKKNDPFLQAPNLGYKITERFGHQIVTGLQKGYVSIYEILNEK